jgi:hypothetical protein
MIKISKILNNFATTTILKPPIPLKKPQPPVSAVSSMSPSVVAQRLNISESALRKMMINPKSNVVSK